MGTGCLCFYASRRSVAPVKIAEDPPLHKTLVYLCNVAKRHPHAARTWQVPRYPLGLPYRELLQGAISVAPRTRPLCARHLSRWVVRAPPPAQGRWFTPSMARDRVSQRPTEKGPVFYRSAGACPPRTWECANNGEGQGFPTPYGKGARFLP